MQNTLRRSDDNYDIMSKSGLESDVDAMSSTTRRDTQSVWT